MISHAHQIPAPPESKTFERYPGGKNAAGTYQWLIDQQPTHARYCEPFAGSFAIGRRKAPALASWAIDLDPRPINWLATLHLPGLRPLIGCGLHWLRTVAPTWDADDLIYCDPPYMLDTRQKAQLYFRELDDDAHAAILAALSRLTCRVMLSAYDHPLYTQALAGTGPRTAGRPSQWYRQERDVITRGGTWATETLWTNYDPAAAVNFADLRYRAGDNYRRRWNITKRVADMQARFADRPTPELAAMAAGLLSLIDRRVRGNAEPFPRPERVTAKTPGKQPGSKRRRPRCRPTSSPSTTAPQAVIS